MILQYIKYTRHTTFINKDIEVEKETTEPYNYICQKGVKQFQKINGVKG